MYAFRLPPRVTFGILLIAIAHGLLPATSMAANVTNVVPYYPPDLNKGDATTATQKQAAHFAWREFIALNWPAVQQTGQLNTRGVADTSLKFGQPGVDGHLVWETLRNKVEIYPGAGSATITPNGYVDDATQDYGFDGLPQYLYDAGTVGTYPGLPAGEIPADVGQVPVAQPSFVNLSEDNEIEEDAMFAGIAPATPFPGHQFLYLAKANRVEYEYIAGNQWWYHSKFDAPAGPLSFLPTVPPQNQTAILLQAQEPELPTPGSTEYVSFPSGTLEVKSAWRRLTETETQSGRFHTSRVRFYVSQKQGESYGGGTGNGNPAYPAYREESWGMCALHIIHKTPSAPYFIYATFEQADNIQNAAGTESVEEVDGTLNAQYSSLSPLDPTIQSTPATATTTQTLTATGPFPDPQNRLYYQNLPTGLSGNPIPGGPIAVQRRLKTIPAAIIKANQFFQRAIIKYGTENKITGSPWQYYKLVNVQWKPLTKATPGAPYVGPNVPAYYLSNSVVETDYNLQVFSGKLDNPGSTNGFITDFYNVNNNNGQPSLVGKPASNVPYNGMNYNMGGCMGCHGNIAQLGADFSFIFNGSSVAGPEFKLIYGGSSLTP